MKGTERREGGEVLGEDGKKQKARAKHTISKCVQSKLLAWHTFTCTMNLEVPKKSTGSHRVRACALETWQGGLDHSSSVSPNRKAERGDSSNVATLGTKESNDTLPFTVCAILQGLHMMLRFMEKVRGTKQSFKSMFILSRRMQEQPWYQLRVLGRPPLRNSEPSSGPKLGS